MPDANHPVTQQQLQEALNSFAVDITAAVRAEVKTEVKAGVAEVKAGIAEVKAEIAEVKAEIAEVKAEIAEVKAEIKAAEERSQEFARGIETNLLTSFHGHARAQTARLHTLDIVAHEHGIRLAAIEERLLNLESRRQ